jgi:ribonuclease M5
LNIVETIIVEGKDDEAAVKLAVNAEVIKTSGFKIKQATFDEIKWANDKNGIIVLTDPDWAGEKIRERINTKFKGCKNAYLSQTEAEKKGNIGVENASSETIQDALLKAKVRTVDIKTANFTMQDLINARLSGCPESSYLRSRLGQKLRIGYGNSKKFLKKLNHYQISKEEFFKTLSDIYFQ